jgi:WD40 repeat protein
MWQLSPLKAHWHETGFHGHQGRVSAISWSPGNQVFATASADGTVQTWGASDGAHVQTYANPYKAKMSSVAWSPDEQSLLAGDTSGRVMLWSVT